MLNSADWRDVAALEEAAAHHHQFADARRDLGRLVERQGDVGERAERAERDGARLFGKQGLDDEIDGVLRLQRHGRLVDYRTVEAGLAVHMFGGHQLADERPVGTGIDLHVAAIAQFADRPGRCGT